MSDWRKSSNSSYFVQLFANEVGSNRRKKRMFPAFLKRYDQNML